MNLSTETRDSLLKLAAEKKLYLEGNLLKVVRAAPGDKEFKDYLKTAKERDTTARRKRLEVTKQVQIQNKELEKANQENQKLMDELKDSLQVSENLKTAAEAAKDKALEDLEVMQKKTQFELVTIIVRLALAVIVGVGVTTSLLYAFVLYMGYDSKIIESTWSNLFGILLTNSFSIVGTIMGVKYATENKDS